MWRDLSWTLNHPRVHWQQHRIKNRKSKRTKNGAHLDILQQHQRNQHTRRGRKNGIAAINNYAEFFRDYKSLFGRPKKVAPFLYGLNADQHALVKRVLNPYKKAHLLTWYKTKIAKDLKRRTVTFKCLSWLPHKDKKRPLDARFLERGFITFS